MKPGYKGLQRLVRASRHSAQGVAACWRGEAAFRQEIALAAVALPLGLYLGADGVERALLTASVLLVPLVELLNSSVESVVDRLDERAHPLSGRAKDLGSAAVLWALALAAWVWLLVLTG
jgi:diacylglycerol kinase (ATP)